MLQNLCSSIEHVSLAHVIKLEDIPELLASVLQGGPPVLNRSWNVVESDGSGHAYLVSLAPVSAPDGSTFGALCNLRDVTDIRRLEKVLHSHERLAALGEMAASVAHEIRNPLCTIEGFARLLRRDLAGMPEHLRLAERIVEGTQNLNYVITNLLTYVRPMRLQLSDFPLGRVLDACNETLRDKAARAGVRLFVTPPPPDIQVRGDERQLIHALLNLGINAIEACERSQAVWIEVVGGRSSVLLRVRDEGCGMDNATLSKIFDPFFTCKEGGTGLGLSLTKKIVDAHGADLTVSSAPGMGSLFTVEFPRTGGSK
jgi:signal transduction histidine kinase